MSMERRTAVGEIHTVQGCLEVEFLCQFNAMFVLVLCFTRQQKTISFRYFKVGILKTKRYFHHFAICHILPQLPIIQDVEFVNNLKKKIKENSRCQCHHIP